MLLTSKNVVKLADLGMTKFMERSTTGTFAGTRAYMSPETFKCNVMYITTGTFAGSPAYMSPETPKSVNEYGEYSTKTDLWLGDLSYYSLTRRLKYD